MVLKWIIDHCYLPYSIYRLVRIAGTTENIAAAEVIIQERIEEYSSSDDDAAIKTKEITISDHLVGRIIGSKGVILKKNRDHSNYVIEISKKGECTPGTEDRYL